MSDKALYDVLKRISTNYQSQGHFIPQLQIYDKDGTIRTVKADEDQEQKPDIYSIDLDSRTIQSPQWLSVEKDHRAEQVYFKMPRYFGATDLALANCLILYENAAGTQGVYPVVGYDVTSFAEDNELLFYWPISGTVTAVSGKVKYSLMFYQLDEANHEVLYSLNLRPAVSSVLYGMSSSIGDAYEENSELATLIQQLGALIMQAESQKYLEWEDMF